MAISNVSAGLNLLSNYGKMQLSFVAMWSTLNAFLELVGISAVMPMIILKALGDEIIAIPVLDRLDFSVLLVVFAFYIISKTFFSIFIIKLRSDVIYKISSTLSADLVTLLLKNPSQYYFNYSGGTASRLAVVECHNYAQSFINPLVTLISDGFLIVAILAFLFIQEPVFTLFTSALFLLMALVYSAVTKNKVTRHGGLRARSDEGRVRYIEGYSSLSLEVVSLDQLKWLMGVYDIKNNSSRDASALYLFWQNFIRPFIELLLYLVLLSVSVYIFYFSVGAAGEGASLTASYFILAGIRVLPSVTKVIGSITALNYSRASVDQLQKCFDTLDTHRSMENVSYSKENCASIKLINYKYRLSADDERAAINCDITHTGLVNVKGQSGSGKSSLFMHLASIRNDFEGHIQIGTTDLATYRAVCFCPQDVFLITGRLRDNIFLTDTPLSYDLQYFNKLTAQLGISDFLKFDAEHGDFWIPNNGLQLSGGQRQRIAILRGVFSVSDIVIFDEPLSSLDKDYRLLVVNIIHELSKNKIVLIASHVEKRLLHKLSTHSIEL